MIELTQIPGESPTHHGICPYCASAVSCVTRDGVTYARCSHRGCGARGPYHRNLVRAVEWFTGRPHPTKAPAQDGEKRCAACVRAGRVGPCIECPGSGVPYGLPATHTGGETRHWTRKPAQDAPEAGERCDRYDCEARGKRCGCNGGFAWRADRCKSCNGTGKASR